MRKYEHRGVAGNCGCCLVPFILLVVMIVAVLAVAAMVFHAAPPNFLRWELTPDHHHSRAYHAGFTEGRRIGAEYAARGEPEPSRQELDELSLREADRSHIRGRDRRQWLEGFRRGFARGFEGWENQASRASSTCIGCASAS